MSKALGSTAEYPSEGTVADTIDILVKHIVDAITDVGLDTVNVNA